MFNGIDIIEVEAGTVVGKNADGEDMIVTETSAVYGDACIWMTNEMFDALKAKSRSAP